MNLSKLIPMHALVSAVVTVGALGATATQAAPAHAARLSQSEPCRNCGVVVSVAQVQRHGQPKGIAGSPVTPGMAIGGVVGGLVGNQIGHGNGRAAATVAGAAGGAYAGHAIEKRRVTYTAYVMNIRMQDGSTRTVEQRTALAKGSRVVVEGRTARATSPATHG